MDLEQVKLAASSHYIMNDHPLLVVDLDSVRKKYREFKKALPQVEVHYAIKCFTDKEVARIISKEGGSFEVASINELQVLGKMLTPAQMERVFYSNPAKSRRSVTIAMMVGVRWFSVDSIEEINKIAHCARHLQIPLELIKIYLRIQGHSKNSLWPLSKKFGAPHDKVLDILNELAVYDDLKISGFTFHVGSQCLDAEAWANCLIDADYFIEQATILNVITEKVLVNMGGGFPSTLTSHDVTLDLIAEKLHDAMARCMNWERIWLAAEPGRFLVQEAGVLCTRVILRTSKMGDNWLYLDSGVFHGMMEPSQGYMGKVSTTYTSPDVSSYILAGPSCDSADVIPVNVTLPTAMREDDLLFIEHSGAYSMSYSTGCASTLQAGFNGFLPPSIHYLHK